MGLEATWSLVDIPANARDAAQAAARREGLSVGEWLTRRILKRFSELNVREQEEAFVAMRNHVSQLANRLDRVEDNSRGEPMREALKKLHQGLARLNDELVRTAGHSAIQISQLSTSLETLNGRVDDLRHHDTENRSAFERRMAQLQEFVDGMNLRHASETRSIGSRMDTLSGTLAESRRLIANERSTAERLEERVAKSDERYGGAFRAVNGKFESVSETIQRIGTAASESSAVLDQRVASVEAALGKADARTVDEAQRTKAALAKLQSKIDNLQADATDMCGALDRRVLLCQQSLQSLDSRHAEISNSLARSVESAAAQSDTIRAESARNASHLETRLANLEASANGTGSNAAADARFAAMENRIDDLANRTGTAADTAADNRFAAIEHQLSDLTNNTNAAMSAASALLPKTAAIETQLEQLNLRFETEVQGQQHAIEQLKTSLIEQTLNALGEKLEAEGRKQQVAIADLKKDVLDQLSQAFNERAQTEDHKQQEAMAQLQANFANALQGLGETFESQARKQQEAIAELKASLAPSQSASAHVQTLESEAAHAETAVVEQAPATLDIPPVHMVTPFAHAEETIVPAAQPDHETVVPLAQPDHETVAPLAQPEHDQILELTTLAEQSAGEPATQDEHAAVGSETIAVHGLPPFAAPESLGQPVLKTASVAAIEQLAPGAMMARDSTGDKSTAAPSYLSAARQSLQAAAVRTEENPGKELFGWRFLKPFSPAAKQKGQATSYALMAGIALVAVLAIVVGAAELMNRGETGSDVHFLAKPDAPHAHLVRVARYVAPKSAVAPSMAFSGQDRTFALAKGGNAQAQLLIGIRDLAKNNDTDAAAWLERAAIQGLPVAQYRVATLFASGRGVAADKVKAFRWYLAAAQAGNRKAMSNLAVAYAQGDGTTKNPQEAGRWFLKAAQLGLADAQFDLAILYERGLGVPQNLTDAYRWYVIAANGGDKESKDRVEALSSQLTTEDRAAAETAAAEFKALPMKVSANEPQ